MKQLSKLQNGTDVRGVAVYDEKVGLEVNLDEREVEAISLGFSEWIRKKLGKDDIKISIGRDSRITGEKFIKVSEKTLLNNKVSVINCSMATTPAMFMSTIMDGYKSDGAIMFTASHMPYIYNGMKMFTSDGCLEKNELAEILNLAQTYYESGFESKETAETENKNLIDDYSMLLSNIIRKGVNSHKNYEKPLSGMKIIVDAGNGSGGFFADKVLKNLGANVEGSQFLEPDGMFPNHIPNPENKEAMKSISDAVIANKADLGIIFDTDVDRAAIVDSNGMEINKNSLIAVISRIILDEVENATIVTDSVTSIGLTEFISKHKGIHHRFKRGYKNVINEAKRLNEEGIESPLAIETSGHAALKENYFLDDGAYLVSKILITVAKMHMEGKKISELISDLNQPKESEECRFKILEEDFKSYGIKVLKDLELFSKDVTSWSKVEPNYEGIRFNCNDDDEKGWFLLRMSLHEPLLVLNIESDINGGCKVIFDKVQKFLTKYKVSL